ncbi:MAG: OmpH family outer membrane protein [bacterium]
MPRLALWICLAFAAMWVAPASAQQVAPPQILTLDQDRLYGDSLYGKALEAKSLAATQALATENRKIEADLSAEEASLTTQRSTVSAADFAKLAAAFDTKVEKIRADQEAKAKQLTAERDAGRKQFFEAAVPVLAEMMRQLGAYAILNHDAVVLSFDSIDVTSRAIAALDAQLGDGTTVPSPQTPVPDQPAPDQPAPEPTTLDPTTPSPPAPDATAPDGTLPNP